MANYEIQNHLGELLSTVTEEELNNLIELAEYNYTQYDASPEYDIVTRLQNAKSEDPTLNLDRFRIYKPIVE
jgi:thermostable 8-oxoguanine DNA glycosylase